MTWATPTDYLAGEVLTATKLQKISDNLSYLYTPNSLLLTNRGTGVTITTTSTTFTVVDAVLYAGSVTLTGRSVKFRFDGALSHNVAASQVELDILIDGTTYLSSLTATPVTNGLWAFRPATGSVPYHFSGHHQIPSGTLSNGAHTFSLVWRVGAAGTAGLVLAAYTAQLLITE